MTRASHILFLLLLASRIASAQEIIGCDVLLEDAKEAYEGGMVELVPELLLECLEPDGLQGESRQEAYRLVINSYLFDYRPEEADSLMDDFVEEFPDYRAVQSDPGEFELLLNAHLIALGIDPDAPLIRETPADTSGLQADSLLAPISAEPIWTWLEIDNSAGFLIGIQGTYPFLTERYSLGDPDEDEGHFGILPGFTLGGIANLKINEDIELGLGVRYHLSRFSYKASPFTASSYRYIEALHYFHIPVSAIYTLNPESFGIHYYGRAGIAADYLLAARGSGTRTLNGSGEEIKVDRLAIKDSRNSLNLNGMLGAGIRIPRDRYFLFVEARYVIGVFRVNHREDRYPDTDLTWRLHHVDSDFRTQHFGIYAGMCWDIDL